jgi:hypothetical protein
MKLNRLNRREQKALEAIDRSRHEYVMLGEMGRDVGRGTIDGLIARGFAVTGPSRYPPDIGYAMTAAGRAALNASYAAPGRRPL